ncbi:MAG: TIGR02206 family membrane protein [Spirochaetia bacterium]
MAKYFDPNYLAGKFEIFSLPHIIALLIVAALNVGMVLVLKKVDSKKVNRYFCYVLSFILLAQELSLNIWSLCIGTWSVGHNLPLHLCGLAVVLSPIMLIRKKKLLYELFYFWGMGGAIQSILTPDNGYAFPHYRMIQTFVSHGAIIMAVIYMTFVEGYRPTWKSVGKTIVITNIYMGIIAVFNLLVNGNYLYICAPPEIPTIIDVLVEIFGPWPWYIFGLEILGIISLVVYYSPFAIKDLITRLRAGPRPLKP